MSVYKVPQDVEADDKILGPFSFRQFIYLIIVCLAGGMAWGLAQLFWPLFMVPIPIIIFFGALALPLRKDQPMEIFLAAMVSFYLKPHRRLWDPDGIDSLIEITAPRIPELQRTKDITQDEAQRRLSYLSNIVDTQGWAVRGAGVQAPNASITSDAFFEASQAPDVLDVDNAVAKSFDAKLNQSDSARHTAMTQIAAGQPPATNYFGGAVAEPVAAPNPTTAIDYDPYGDIQQAMIKPLDDVAAPPPPPAPVQPVFATPAPITTSVKPPSAAIMNLAVNDDLSIETIAREANRIHDRQDMSEEVVISLR